MTSLTADDLPSSTRDGITASMSASARTGSTGEGSSSRVWAPNATAVSVIGDSNEWRAGGRRALSRRNEWCLVGADSSTGRRGAITSSTSRPATDSRSTRPIRSRSKPSSRAGRRRSSQISRSTGTTRGGCARAQAVRASTRRYRSTRCTSDRGCVAPTDSPFRTARPASGSLGTRTTTASRTWSCSRSWSIHSSARGGTRRRRTSRRRLDSGRRRTSCTWLTCWHGHDVGVILDWVPSHFPSDDFALAQFDGSTPLRALRPPPGVHPDWDTLVFNYEPPRGAFVPDQQRVLLARPLSRRRAAG